MPPRHFKHFHHGEETRQVNGSDESGGKGTFGRGGHREKLEPEVQSEDDKDESEKVAGDGGN